MKILNILESIKLKKYDLIFFAISKRFLFNNKFNITFAFIVYLIGSFAILIANFNYIDDIDRTLYGTFGFSFWNRYSAGIVSSIINLNSKFLLTIFPYSLFISLFILSLCSVMLVAIIDKNLLKNKIAILASTAIGLSPYFLENLSYKFDSPFMTLSIFASIFPFLFIRYKKIFILVSIISILIMLTSYQASSGIYMMIMIFLGFKQILDKNYKSALNFILYSLASYILAGVLFLLFYEPASVYANNEILPLKHFLIGIYKHISQYLNVIYSDFGWNNIMLSIIIGFGIIFIAKSTINASINKFFAFFISSITLILLLILSFGLYIIIVMPTYFPRSFIGFGVFITIISLYSITFYSKSLKIISTILIIIFVNYLIVFANYYGQTLKAHDDYQRFRFTLVMNDLNKFLDNSQLNLNSRFNIETRGYAGSSPSIVYSKKYYPLIERLIPIIQSKWVWGVIMLEHYGISADVSESCKGSKDMEILVDSYYHTIHRYKDNNEICYLITYKDVTKHKIER